jgi:hypothetical protein
MRNILFIIIFLLSASVAHSATIWCNPANNGTQNGTTKATGYKTLHSAMAAMSYGDTVIIANGNWASYSNMNIDGSNSPPSGTAGAYSKIIAETEWEVTIHHINVGISRSYVEIRGIVFDARVNPISNIVYDWHHTKFIRCGFLMGKITGNNHNVGFGSADSSRSSNHHNLMEECIAWGGGRYVFYNKYGQYNIFRRCVARHDNQEGGDNPNDDGQIANFRAYACDFTAYQNCISIDSNRVSNYNNGTLQWEAGGYWVGDSYGAEGNVIDGSFSIKDVHMGYYLGSSGYATATVRNSVALSISKLGYSTLNGFVVGNDTNVDISNFLGISNIGTSAQGLMMKNYGSLAASRSIVRDVTAGGIDPDSGSNNYYFNAPGSSGTNADPFLNGLRYPVRIESGSTLASVNGGIVGPTILKKIGVSGTLYGETGWDTVTNDNLWPFPNEAKIKELMSTTVDGVSGAYGFTTGTSIDGSAQTLTKYIWEQFGNQIPADIYGGSGGTTVTLGTVLLGR